MLNNPPVTKLLRNIIGKFNFHQKQANRRKFSRTGLVKYHGEVCFMEARDGDNIVIRRPNNAIRIINVEELD